MNKNKFNLTQKEQINLVNGGSFFGTSAVPEKNIKSLQLLDGGTGINFEQLFGDFLSRDGKDGIGGDALRDVLKNFYNPSELKNEQSKKLYDWICDKLKSIIPDMTAPGCYPPGIFLASTWNPDVIYKTGTALGQEAAAYGVNILLGTPNVNIHRDIRNGRLFEGYSEDPCVVSELAPSLVKGVQSEGVAANVKHFAANHQETNRMNINEYIPERALHEIYYPGFKACVKADVATVMSAYNQINGVPCTENRQLLNDILRDEWGFDGVVMSDWNAVYHPAEAINAGNDLAMPGPIAPDVLMNACENGSLSAECLELSANRVAELSEKYAKMPSGVINRDMTDSIAYETASEGIILLKNSNNILPLEKSSTIALFGEKSDYLLTCGEGSAGVITNRNISLVKALAERFDSVSHNAFADDSDTFIYVYSLPGQEGNDRNSISISKNERDNILTLIEKSDSKNMKKILVLNVSAPVTLDGLENEFDGIFCIFLPGMQGANALADCLCGNVNPSGKTPLTWPAGIEDMPTYLNFPGDGMQVHYGEGIFVGYRWYDARNIQPLYPFGFGLSYTDFEILSFEAENENFSETVTVNAVVKNSGTRDGKTVVQVYVSDRESSLTKPLRELKAFRKIFLRAGEQMTVSFKLDKHDFESYDPNLCAWTMEEGYYDISVGFSSRELCAECSVYADVKSPYSYGENTSVKIIMENENLKNILFDFFEKENLTWSNVLTSYQYTPQDKISMILEQVSCTDEQCRQLYSLMSRVKKI
ncbi:MAG: glycoside hydrolase family 3 C-terminal domain-containing protein [Oscillospiraceae bacterium]|nr:glycoside hydrolase family 3 C-terminal domain-containing protein [Oscillospiraceae bacterium]